MRARVSGEGFQEFSAEGENVSEVFRDAEEKLRAKIVPADMPPDFSLEWIPEHVPKVDDDVHRWLRAWADQLPISDKRLFTPMIREYEEYARDARVLRE